MLLEGQLRHLVNGIQVEEPERYTDLKEEVERSVTNRLISGKFPFQLSFIGDGYALLRSYYLDDYCTIVPYELQQYVSGIWTRISLGEIIVADITFELTRGKANTTITDLGAGSRIMPNKDIVIYPSADKTKNGDDVTPAPALSIEIYDPAAALGTYLSPARTGYDWLACMDHLVQSISDGRVTVVSDWYNALPDDERYAMFNGSEVRSHNTATFAPGFNFTDLFNGLARPYDLWAAVESNGDDAILRIEPSAYFFGSGTGPSFPNTDGLEQSVDTRLLYQLVRLGSEGAVKNELADAAYSLPYITLRTFSKEEFHLEGTCNTDSILDLTNKFVTDTNAIEHAAINSSNGNDEKVFIIQYDQNTNKAVKGEYLDPGVPPYLYNPGLYNEQIINRYRLPAAGVVYYAPQTAEFRAEYTTANPSFQNLASTLGTDTTTTTQVFDNDYAAPNNDVANNWGNGTTQGNPVSSADSRYTAPAQGFYQFSELLIWEIAQNTAQDALIIGSSTPALASIAARTIYSRFSSGNTLLQSAVYTSVFAEQVTQGTFEQTFQHGFSLNTGDYVVVTRLFISTPAQGTIFGPSPSFSTDVRFLPGSSLFTSFVALGGGRLTPPDPDQYYATLLKFKRHLSITEWLAYKADISQQISVSENENMRIGYVRKISRTVHNGETEWEIICNRNQEFK